MADTGLVSSLFWGVAAIFNTFATQGLAHWADLEVAEDYGGEEDTQNPDHTYNSD